VAVYKSVTVAFAQTTGALAFVEIILRPLEGPGLAILAPGAREYGNAATRCCSRRCPVAQARTLLACEGILLRTRNKLTPDPAGY
jgi:hypothetical protein